MALTEVLYVRFKGRTASFRVPTTISGAQLSLEIPSYATIIGLLSNLLDRKYDPADKRIGMRYAYQASSLDLETTHRWKRDSKSGTIAYHKTNPRKRQVHYEPVLELFLSDVDLYDELRSPKRVPSLGRSQDLARIDYISIIKAKAIPRANLVSTLIPLSLPNTDPNAYDLSIDLSKMTGIMYVLPTDFDVSELGKIRIPLGFRTFLATSKHALSVTGNNLFQFTITDVNPGHDYPWLLFPPEFYLYQY